jgi:hypothetical protein
LENGDVVDQIKGYQAVINAHHADIADSYWRVAKNLAAIEKWSNGVRSLAPATRDAATKAKINVKSSTIGLIVYDFTADQRDRKGKDGKTLREKLTELFDKNCLSTERFRFKGTAKGLTL